MQSPAPLGNSGRRVHLIDGDEEFVIAVTDLLSTSGFDVAGYPKVAACMQAFPSDQVSCLLVDRLTLDRASIDLLNQLAAQDALPPVILLSTSEYLPTVVEILKGGVIDYLVKPIDTELLLKSVRGALSLDLEHRPKRLATRAIRTCYALLTDVERRVFRGVAMGELDKQLCEELEISPRTVKNLRSQVMEKMRAPSVPDLVRAASALGMFGA